MGYTPAAEKCSPDKKEIVKYHRGVLPSLRDVNFIFANRMSAHQSCIKYDAGAEIFIGSEIGSSNFYVHRCTPLYIIRRKIKKRGYEKWGIAKRCSWNI